MKNPMYSSIGIRTIRTPQVRDGDHCHHAWLIAIQSTAAPSATNRAEDSQKWRERVMTRSRGQRIEIPAAAQISNKKRYSNFAAING